VIVAAGASDRVISLVTAEEVIPAFAINGIVAAQANDDVIAGRADQHIVAWRSDDRGRDAKARKRASRRINVFVRAAYEVRSARIGPNRMGDAIMRAQAKISP